MRWSMTCPNGASHQQSQRKNIVQICVQFHLKAGSSVTGDEPTTGMRVSAMPVRLGCLSRFAVAPNLMPVVSTGSVASSTVTSTTTSGITAATWASGAFVQEPYRGGFSHLLARLIHTPKALDLRLDISVLLFRKFLPMISLMGSPFGCGS